MPANDAFDISIQPPEPNPETGVVDPAVAIPYLAQRCNLGKVAAFAGAGASASAGLPLWSAIGDELKRRLKKLNRGVEDIPALASMYVDEMSKALADRKAARKKLVDLIQNLVYSAGAGQRPGNFGEIYPRLAKLPIANFYTTNWDQILVKCLIQRDGGVVETFGNQTIRFHPAPANGSSRHVVFLHGTVPGPLDQVIVTSEDYFQFEMLAKGVFDRLVTQFKADTTLLCVGHSFGDLNYADYLRKAKTGGHPGCRIYALLPMLSMNDAFNLWRNRRIYPICFDTTRGDLGAWASAFLDSLLASLGGRSQELVAPTVEADKEPAAEEEEEEEDAEALIRRMEARSAFTDLPRPLVRPPTHESVFAETPPVPAVATAPGCRTVLAIATEWFSRHGGLSTLNRELCAALAGAGHRVACLVPTVSDDEIADASARGVLLVTGRTTPGGDPLHRPAPVPKGFVPDIVVGHGRVTGPAAVAQAEDAFAGAARVHMIHMAPGEIEWLKDQPGAAVRAEDRERLELDLSRGAAVVAAVGPRLARETENLLAALDAPPPVVRLDPGLTAGGDPRQPPSGLHVLLLGRAEDLELKGLDIAAAAMARLTHLDARPFASEPILVVRGAPAGEGAALRRRLLDIAGKPGLQIRVREHTADVERLTADLRRASLVLMPSRGEGFGLVGFEAIAAGVPVLISDRSGLGELLTERCFGGLPGQPLKVGDRASFVIRVTGDLDIDAEEWARAAELVLREPRAAFTRAVELRETLAAELDWEITVVELFAALDSS